MKVPRKKKKQIPRGHYCYTFTGKTSMRYSEEFGTEVQVYHVKLCPFYKHDKGLFGKCKLLDCEITDQCKECTIKQD